MAAGSLSLEGISLQDNSRAHFGHNISSHEAQNFPGQTVNGTQNIYMNGHPAQAHPGRCTSEHFETVSTYTDRPDLSKELEKNLATARGTRAVAVIGLGGTGKTQLVLHYIEEHEAEYDTVLWIDVRDREAARASFERCCRALGLPVEASPNESVEKPLHDVPCVQTVLNVLRARSEDKKWLTVIDNADDLLWDISSIIPRGKAGTVLVTSQNYLASRLLGGRMPTVKVDAMQAEEAVRLVANHFGEQVSRGDDYWDLIEKITECLDRLALPMDLAGARISVHAETWGDLTTALKQYLEDYHHNQDTLLHDTEYANATPYKKTVWTAWETSLSSLKAKEESQGIYPVQLLAFLTLFDRANVQDELFRLASLGLDIASHDLEASVPKWLQELLEKDDSNEWNNTLYKHTVECLLRYGLVRPVNTSWKGVTMHGLVQTRARRELPSAHSQGHMIFLYAICLQVKSHNSLHFRRYLAVHLPTNDELLKGQIPFRTEIQMTPLWLAIGDFRGQEGRVSEAVQLHVKTVDVTREHRGEIGLETIRATCGLAVSLSRQGLTKDAIELFSKVARLMETALGATHPDTLGIKHLLATTMSLGERWEDAVEHHTIVVEARTTILGKEHCDTLRSMMDLAIAYLDLEKLSMAQELQAEVLETQDRLYGRVHPDTISSMRHLAITYSMQGKYQESETIHLEALQAAMKLFGNDHEETLNIISDLGMFYAHQEKLEVAEELQIKLLGTTENLYGSDHPKTLQYTNDLAILRGRQGRLVEAERMLVDVPKAQTSLLGEEHLDTLGTVHGLAITLSKQERWQEAGDLATMMMEAYSRMLGKNHVTTLGAMGTLAKANRYLGQNDAAVDIMRQCAIASSEARGDNHPDTVYYRETAARWTEMDSKNVEDVVHSVQSS